MAEAIPAQIDYTSRDYESLREDLIARIQERVPEWNGDDPSDFGIVLVEAFAHLGDLVSYYIDRAANESTLSTATRRESVVALAKDLGYEPLGFQPSSVVLSFTNSSESAVEIPVGTRVAANVDSGSAVLNVPFETDEDVTVEPGGVNFVTATQGFTVLGTFSFGEDLGMSTGEPTQSFTLLSPGVVTQSVQVYVYDGVNYFPWQRVDHFADYSPLSRVYRVIDDGSGNYQVEFGDGVSGLVPPISHFISATYRVVDGTNGNVPAGSITDIEEIPGLTESQVSAITGSITVTNDSPATGGTDPEDTDSIRRAASMAFRSTSRAVTLEDFQNLAMGVSGVGKASALSETPASVLVAVAPSRNFGSAEPKPGYDDLGEVTVELEDIKQRVTETLRRASVAGVTASVLDPVYLDVAIEISAVVIPSVRQADAEVLIRQALLSRFDYSSVPFGSSIYPSDLISTVASLGVTADVSVDLLKDLTDSDGVSVVTAQEFEILSVSASNLAVTVTGGVEDQL
jgi:phage-related baseplate assembly protein